MASVELALGSTGDDAPEQRHCPECGSIYTCSPRWRIKTCPACNGKRIQRFKKNPAADVRRPTPTEPYDVPAEMTALDRELTAMRVASVWLEDLDAASRTRVLQWLSARYDPEGTHV